MNVFDALLFAERAHRGQVDKLGEPYIGHILRVVRNVREAGEGDSVQQAAALHDVVEDTRLTLEDIKAAGFAPGVVTAIRVITRRAKEPYEDYILRVARNPMTTAVKRADVKDNMDPVRLASLDEATRIRLEKKYRFVPLLLDTGGR